jgi:hypothetical protein
MPVVVGLPFIVSGHWVTAYRQTKQKAGVATHVCNWPGDHSPTWYLSSRRDASQSTPLGTNLAGSSRISVAAVPSALNPPMPEGGHSQGCAPRTMAVCQEGFVTMRKRRNKELNYNPAIVRKRQLTSAELSQAKSLCSLACRSAMAWPVRGRFFQPLLRQLWCADQEHAESTLGESA